MVIDLRSRVAGRPAPATAFERTRSLRALGTPITVRSRPRFAGVVFAGDLMALLGGASLVLPRPVAWWAWAFVLATVTVLAVSGGYRQRITPSVATDCGYLLACVAIPVAALALLVGRDSVSKLMLTAAVSAGLLVAARLVCYAVLRRIRAMGRMVENTLIIGAGQVGVQLAQILQEHPEYGLIPVGFLDGFDDTDLPLPILGDVRSLDQVLTEYSVRRVVLAFGATREPDMVPIVRACDRLSVDIHVLPRFFELGFAAKGRDVDNIWGIPLLRLRRAALRSNAWRVKRAFDVIVAGLALLVVSPIYLLLAAAVKLSSPGPVYHRQLRIGQRGGPVEILKFRSMRVNGDAETQWSVVSDDRTTPVGRFMRRLSLDELPQFLNVLRGEMSMVGPRPERPFFVDRFKNEIPRYADRHRVPVGLTGLAQIHGLRGDTPIDERASFDNQYIENWSLWWDVVILLRTVSAVIRHARHRA